MPWHFRLHLQIARGKNIIYQNLSIEDALHGVSGRYYGQSRHRRIMRFCYPPIVESQHQFLALSTILDSPIQDIMDRSFSPTSSIGCLRA